MAVGLKKANSFKRGNRRHQTPLEKIGTVKTNIKVSRVKCFLRRYYLTSKQTKFNIGEKSNYSKVPLKRRGKGQNEKTLSSDEWIKRKTRVCVFLLIKF